MTDICIVGFCGRTRRFGIGAASASMGGAGARLSGRAWRGLVYCHGPSVLPSIRTVNELLETGWRGKALLDSIQSIDGDTSHRLLLTIDADGRTAECMGTEAQKISYARRTPSAIAASSGYSSASAVVGMLEKFDEDGDQALPERLMRAVEAGGAASGGRFRSAFLHVHDPSVEYPYVDVTVDLHQDPVAELRRAHDWLAPLYAYYALRGQDPTIARYPQWLEGLGIKRQ